MPYLPKQPKRHNRSRELKDHDDLSKPPPVDMTMWHFPMTDKPLTDEALEKMRSPDSIRLISLIAAATQLGVEAEGTIEAEPKTCGMCGSKAANRNFWITIAGTPLCSVDCGEKHYAELSRKDEEETRQRLFALTPTLRPELQRPVSALISWIENLPGHKSVLVICRGIISCDVVDKSWSVDRKAVHTKMIKGTRKRGVVLVTHHTGTSTDGKCDRYAFILGFGGVFPLLAREAEVVAGVAYHKDGAQYREAVI